MKNIIKAIGSWLNWMAWRGPIGPLSVDRPPETEAPSSAFAVAGGCPAREYFVAIVLSKCEDGGGTKIALRTALWTGTSENEALGAAVADAMSANPGYHLGMTRVLTAQDNTTVRQAPAGALSVPPGSTL